MNDIPVLKITRSWEDAVHFLPSEIPEGTDVSLKVDWQRRFDHMQQHTGKSLKPYFVLLLNWCSDSRENIKKRRKNGSQSVPVFFSKGYIFLKFLRKAYFEFSANTYFVWQHFIEILWCSNSKKFLFQFCHFM